MKKYIFPLLAFALLSTQSWGQTKPTEAQTELNAYMDDCLLYTSPSPRDRQKSRMPSSA